MKSFNFLFFQKNWLLALPVRWFSLRVLAVLLFFATDHYSPLRAQEASWLQVGANIAATGRDWETMAASKDGKTVAVADWSNDSYSGLVRVYRNVNDVWTQVGNDLLGQEQYARFGFGLEISADGTVLAVSEPYFGSNDRGKVKVFQLTNDNWVQMGEDLVGYEPNSVFGASISISADGQTLAVGIGNTAVKNGAYIFRFIGGSWLRFGSSIETDITSETRVALAADGLRLLVSSPSWGDAANGFSGMGQVNVFQLKSGIWEQVGSPIFGSEINERLGEVIAISGDGSTLAIGRPNYNSSLGLVRTFRLLGDKWTQFGQNLHARYGGSGFGTSISFNADGSVMAVGASTFAPCGTLGMAFLYRNIGDTWVSEGESIFNGNGTNDYFGQTVSLSADGRVLAANAPVYYYNTGFVKVFRIVNTGWKKVGGDINGEADLDLSGSSVSISSDGSAMAIGSPETNSYGEGKAKIYKKVNGAWVQEGANIDGETQSDKAGSSVSISADGTRVAVAAPSFMVNNIWAGQVRIFENTNGTWTQLGASIVGPPTTGGGPHEFGSPTVLSADGTTVAIGAPRYPGNFQSFGRARVFKYANGAWTQLGATFQGITSSERLGESLAISADGSVVAVGSRLANSNRGRVSIYKWENDAWAQIGTDIDGLFDDEYSASAISLSADGSTIAVGSPRYQVNNVSVGRIRIFKNINGTWTQIGTDITGNNLQRGIGYALGLSADGLSVAASSNTVQVCPNQYGAFIYKFVGGQWVRQGLDIANPDKIEAMAFSADGSHFVLGSPEAAGDGNMRGVVRVHQTTVCTPPTVFAVTGGGLFSTQALAIGLTGSEVGVEYQLIRNGNVFVGSPVAGTGNSLAFQPQTMRGKYTVQATRLASRHCPAMMTGSASVTFETEPPSLVTCPQNLTINASADCLGHLEIPFPTLLDNQLPIFWYTQFSGNANGTPSPTAYWQNLSKSADLTFSPGATSVQISAIDMADNISLASCSFTVTVQTPILQVLGGAPLQSIAHGDFSPSLADHTDFGGAVSRTFTLKNIGSAPFTVNEITLGNPLFLLSGDYLGEVPAGGSRTFTATFKPNGLQQENCAIAIKSTQCGAPAAPYSFNFQLRATAQAQITCPPAVTVGNTPGDCSGTVAALGSPDATANFNPTNALHFQPSDDRVQLSNLTFNSTFSIEAWIKPTYFSYTSYSILTNKNASNGSGLHFALEESSGHRLKLETNGAAATSNLTLLANAWHHVAVTSDGSTVKMYINGIESALQSGAGFNFTAPDQNTFLGNFNGSIGEVRIWNTARTAAEIADNLNTTFSGSTPGLVAYYVLNQGVAGGNNSSVTTITDLAPSTGGANNGTLQNFALSGSTSNWIAGRVLFIPTTFTNNAPATFPLGSSTVTWSATFFNGSTYTCQQNVSVVDNELPVPEIPNLPDIAAACNDAVTLTAPTATDNCNGTLYATTSTGMPITAAGLTVVNWVFDDGFGNVFSQTQNVVIACDTDNDGSETPDDCNDSDANVRPEAVEICNGVDDDCDGLTDAADPDVLDSTLPTISSCPENQNLTVAAGACSANFSIPAPTIADDCSIAPTWNANFSGNANGNPANLTNLAMATASGNLAFSGGTTSVVLTASDAKGNISTQNCAFEVTVNFRKIKVSGGSPALSIAAGDGTPTTADGTDFGSNLSQIFTIENEGNQPLTIANIFSSNSKFKISGGTGLLAAGSSTSFKVAFSPTDLAAQNANIRIVSDACDASNFIFSVTATGQVGIVCPPPVTVGVHPGSCSAAVLLAPPTALSNFDSPNALNFNEQNDKVSLGLIDLQPPAFTIEFWAKRTQSNYFNQVTILGQGTNMWIGFTNYYTFKFGYLTATVPGDNQWHHWACVFNSAATDKILIYMDGNLMNSSTYADYYFQGSGNYYLGRISDYLNSFKGGLQEVRFWNTARSQSQIQNAMNSTLVGNEPDLKAYYKLDQGIAGGSNPTETTAIATTGANGTLSNFALSGATSNWVDGRNTAPTPVFSNDAPSVFPAGTTMVNWSSSIGGTTYNCQQTVSVIENVPPVPDLSSLPDFDAVCAATPPAPTATDDCDGVLTATTNTVFPITALGTTVVTWTFTDASGNAVSQNQNINLICDADNDGFTPPLDCNNNDPNIHPNATEICNGVDDDCDGFADGADSDLPDDTPPTISNCPENQNLTVAAGACSANFSIPAPTIADNCSATMTWNAAFSGNANGNPDNLTSLASTSPSGNAAFSKGTTSVLLTAFDGKGNASTQNCAFEVVVVDNDLPQILCPQNVSVNTAAGTCFGTATWTPPVGTDNCSGATTAGSHTPGDSFGKGTTAVIYTATDAASNTKTCSFSVVVSDTELPSIACPQNISLNIAPGTCSNTATWTTPVGTDNCPETVTTSTHAPGNSFGKGSTTVVYQATDASGNSKTCTFNVVVSDNEKPTIACPQDVSVNVAAGTCSNIATWTPPVGTDNCSGATTTGSHSSGSSFPKGATLVTYTTTDASANSETCSFNVVVLDNEKPSLTCPQDVSVNIVAGTCSNTATWTPPVGTDNCSGATTNGSHSSGDTFSAGTTTVIYTTTDASANSETCTFNVVVSDNEPPVITCPSNQNIAAGTGCASQLGIFYLLSKMDNCTASADISVSQSPASTTILDGIDDSETVSLTATDGHANSTTCSFTVTLKDLTGPAAPVLETINAICTATPSVPTAPDNCAGTIMATTTTEFPITALGTTTVTWVFNDGNGNTTTAAQNVNVVCDQDDDGHYPPNDCNDLDNTIYPSAPEICDFKDNDCDLATDEGLIHIELGIAATTATCATADNASVNLTVVAGAPPLSFSWATGQTSEDLTQLFSGNYAVTVSGSDGCTGTAAVEVEIFNNMDLGMVKVPPTCFGNSSGAIFSAPSGGTAPYAFAWSNSKTTQNVNLLGAGSYTLTLTDADACTYVEAATLVSPPALTMSVSATPTTATIVAGGGTPGYLYNRTGALSFQPNPVFNGLTPGASYIFKTQDANGCQKSVLKKLPTSMAPAGSGTDLKLAFDRFEIENQGENQFIIFPNPADNYLKINFLNENKVVGQVKIFNQIGQKVLTQNLSIEPSEEGVLNVGHLPEGTFFLHFKNENGETASQRLLIFRD